MRSNPGGGREVREQQQRADLVRGIVMHPMTRLGNVLHPRVADPVRRRRRQLGVEMGVSVAPNREGRDVDLGVRLAKRLHAAIP